MRQRHHQAAPLLQRGLAAQRQGRHSEAVAALRRAATLQPGNGATQAHLGLSLLSLGQHEPAVAAYTRAASLLPPQDAGRLGVHNNLGVACRALDRPHEAAAAYRRAHAETPDDAMVCLNLGRALAACGEIAEARTAFAKAIANAPASPTPWIHLGVTEQEFGAPDAAMTAFNRALALDPNAISAWYCRSDLKTFTPDDLDIARMAALLPLADRSGRPAEEPVLLRFALGKACLDAGADDRAFAWFHEANRRKRAGFAYDVEADLAHMAAMAGHFTPALLQRFAGRGHTSETPILIVGMPRSGSTLIEQILASHPDIGGIGETLLLGRRLAPALALVSGADTGPETGANSLASLAHGYVEALTRMAPGKQRVADKALGHVRYVGLIHLMLPNARIIQCRRNPIDTGLSCYTRHFGGHQPFAYNLHELGRYQRGVDALMAHWRRVIPPDRLIDVAYEDLVQDLPGTAQRLVAFCGLDWNAACLRFHETRRAIRTTSMQQARTPLYASSVGRWRRYQPHLAPLLAALGSHDDAPV